MAESLAISDYKNLGVLNTKIYQDRSLAISDLRLIYALDTETYKGNVFLIADSDGRCLDEITPESVIKFLFHKKFQNSWNFFYNITYDAEVILKLLGKELNNYKKTRKLEFRFQDFKIEYIPNKKLAIRKGHHSSVFFDIAQFYHASLKDAYQKNIGKLQQEYLEIKQKRNGFSRSFYGHNKKIIRNYCIQDCILTKQLAEKWITLFHNAFGFYPQRWVSSGYLAEKVLINNHIEIPKFDSIPYEIQNLAFQSYFGGRFEILKRGFIGIGYLYDINSAYPNALAQIPNLSKGNWIQQKSINPDSKLGFFRIIANIPDLKYVPPFPFRKNYSIIFPSGRFETCVTLAELLACENPKYYKILDSYQFIPSSDEYPYSEFIKQLYQKRLTLKAEDNPLQLPIKTVMNSIYGKTGQKTNRKIGNLFNPVLFATITGLARAQLYRFVMENNLERNVVSFATDSICVTKKLDIDSDKLGEFSFDDSANDVFVLQNGINRFNGKWKQRGLGKLQDKDIEHLETIVKKGKLYLKFKVLRSSRLRSSILQDRLSDIGRIKTFEKEVNLNADKKRFWLGEIKSIDSKIMNDSIPISMNYFEKNEI